MHVESHNFYCRKHYRKLQKDYPDFETMYRKTLDSFLVYLNDGIDFLANCHFLTTQTVGNVKVDVYKLQVPISGLKRGQWPRLWIGVSIERQLLIPLTLGVHKDNYADNEMFAQAVKLIEDYLQGA